MFKVCTRNTGTTSASTDLHLLLSGGHLSIPSHSALLVVSTTAAVLRSSTVHVAGLPTRLSLLPSLSNFPLHPHLLCVSGRHEPWLVLKRFRTAG
jgi:hypothetical protein